MRMHVRGKGSDGKPIEVDLDLPSTLKVGDTFAIGRGEGQEEVEILGMQREKDPDGAFVTTVVVGPLPDYGWAEAPAEAR